MAPEIRAIIITVSGQLLVVRCNYGARGLLQPELIPGPIGALCVTVDHLQLDLGSACQEGQRETSPHDTWTLISGPSSPDSGAMWQWMDLRSVFDTVTVLV